MKHRYLLQSLSIPRFFTLLLAIALALISHGCGGKSDSLSGIYVADQPILKEKLNFQYKMEFKSDGTVHRNAMFSEGTDGTYTINGTELVVQIDSETLKFKIEADVLVDSDGDRWVKEN